MPETLKINNMRSMKLEYLTYIALIFQGISRKNNSDKSNSKQVDNNNKVDTKQKKLTNLNNDL